MEQDNPVFQVLNGSSDNAGEGSKKFGPERFSSIRKPDKRRLEMQRLPRLIAPACTLTHPSLKAYQYIQLNRPIFTGVDPFIKSDK
jgi:hypothetical protein